MTKNLVYDIHDKPKFGSIILHSLFVRALKHLRPSLFSPLLFAFLLAEKEGQMEEGYDQNAERKEMQEIDVPAVIQV